VRRKARIGAVRSVAPYWKGPTYWQHADGSYGIDLSHAAAGAISQEFDTKAHTKYIVAG
jgi:hypothetical protein